MNTLENEQSAGSAVTDRRVKRTKKLLKQSLTKLLLEKELKDVSVLELTELADVNRGTFYLHYKDIYDLYEQMEDEIINHFRTIIKKHRLQNQQGIPYPLVLNALEFLARNADICVAILRTNDTVFLSKLIEMNKPEDAKTWRVLLGDINKDLYEYYYSFITAGCVGLLRSWFLGGMKESPAKMAALAESIMSRTIWHK